MKSVVAVFFVAAVLSGAIAQATEPIIDLNSTETYVIEPIFESNHWRCPPKTKVIAKYCWEGVYGSFMRCGYVCHPIKNIGNGGGMPPSP